MEGVLSLSEEIGGAICGDFPSLKLGRSVKYHSTIERDLLYILEYEAEVERYQEQPFTIQGMLGDGKHRYTPDYAIWTTGERLLVECKPANKQMNQHSLQQQALGEDWCQRNGWRYQFVTDEDLRRGHRLDNLKLLWRYSRLYLPPSQLF